MDKIVKKIMNQLNQERFDGSSYYYSVMMGILSSSLILILEITFYLTVRETEIRTIYVYLAAAMVMLIQGAHFLRLLVQNEIRSVVDRFIIEIHPYLIIGIGIAVTQAYQGFTNRVDSYMVAVLAAALIAYYHPKKSTLMFTTTYIVFIFMMYLYHGFNQSFFTNIRTGFMINILANVYTVIAYYRYHNGRRTSIELKKNEQDYKRTNEELQALNLELEYNNKITSMMMEISTDLLKIGDVDEILQIILARAIDVMPGAEAGTILIAEGDQMVFRAACGYNPEKIKNITLTFEDTFQFKLKNQREPEVIRDLRKFNAKYLDESKAIQFKVNEIPDAKAVLTCAIVLDDQLIGSINLDNLHDPDAFHEEDKSLIKHLASQIEIALKNHKLVTEMLRMSRIDGLTGANTRKYHEELLDKLYAQSKTDRQPFGFVLIDLNDLKDINDKHGHHMGDQLLVHFASLVRTVLKDSDIFSRTGGDEFTLIFPNCTKDQTLKRVKELHQKFRDYPMPIEGVMHKVQFGAGVVNYPDDATLLQDLVLLADKRMYENKDTVKSEKRVD